ncbi:uncharacterized protein LOC117182247 [Belonocnema kinseyi]|uniref:uncharacterized protein LOC117182247 n=1 Tax=Belonocnema kinseyi TaxID=2817044 RepID=UPI00143D289A|nr:uncharacterized protein LOC117182247 [Belonocnema kinseyi]
MSITHAYVYLTNGLQRIVSLSSIGYFFTQSENDFNRNRKQKVWLKAERGKEDLLLNAYILLLASEFDVQTRRDNMRLKFPNKRMLSFARKSKPTGLQVGNKKKMSMKPKVERSTILKQKILHMKVIHKGKKSPDTKIILKAWTSIQGEYLNPGSSPKKLQEFQQLDHELYL